MSSGSLLKLSMLKMSLLKMSLLILSKVEPATDAWADDYQEGLARLKAQQSEFDRSLAKLGVKAGPQAASIQERRDGEPRSLFETHGDLRQLQLAKGRFLFGRVVNRLVVGPEGSPSIIEILPGQGAASGLRLLGQAHQMSTASRLGIEFKSLVFKSGKSIPLQATGLDESGAYGLSAQVVSQKALAVVGAMASSFVSGLASAQQTQITGPFGFQQTQVNGRNAVLQGVAQTAADQSKRLIDEATAEKPILIVEPETPVTVLIQEEVRW